MAENPPASDVELFTLVATALIALVALGLSIYEGWESRRHNRLSVRPFLTEAVRMSPAHERMCLVLKNNGLGPAVVKKWTLHVDGKPCEELGLKTWEQLTAHLCLGELGIESTTATLSRAISLPPTILKS